VVNRNKPEMTPRSVSIDRVRLRETCFADKIHKLNRIKKSFMYFEVACPFQAPVQSSLSLPPGGRGLPLQWFYHALH